MKCQSWSFHRAVGQCLCSLNKTMAALEQLHWDKVERSFSAGVAILGLNRTAALGCRTAWELFSHPFGYILFKVETEMLWLRKPQVHTCMKAPATQILVEGTTRNNFEEKKVIHLEYEAYVSMAETEIKKICRDVRQKWPSVKHIAVHHRLGVVPVTEASVIIAISSPHRAESLEAVMYCINTLKASVPIWKKEIYEGEYSWKENKECFWTNSEK